MANVALSIDGILPALTNIGQSLNHTDSTDLQAVITVIFLGLGIGQLVFGTLSDSLGRKPIVYAGVVIFLIASVIAVNAHNLEMMLVARFLQGIGLSAPRSISISIIRDLYKGDYMARIMSFITVVFYFGTHDCSDFRPIDFKCIQLASSILFSNVFYRNYFNLVWHKATRNSN